MNRFTGLRGGGYNPLVGIFSQLLENKYIHFSACLEQKKHIHTLPKAINFMSQAPFIHSLQKKQIKLYNKYNESVSVCSVTECTVFTKNEYRTGTSVSTYSCIYWYKCIYIHMYLYSSRAVFKTHNNLYFI